MKKFWVLIAALLIPLTLSPAASAVQEVVISEPTHRLSDGVFFDDLLAIKLSPTGSLGILVYSNSKSVRTWLIDPATIEEILAMSNGYGVLDGATPAGQQIAKDWLAQFEKVSKGQRIYSLTYGNPSNYWVDQLLKNELQTIKSGGKNALEQGLIRSTSESDAINGEKQPLSKSNINLIKYMQRQINLLGTVVDKDELLSYQLRISQLLNPDIDKEIISYLLKDFDKSITGMRNKLRVTKSKFTITSAKEELPITLVNNFDTPVNLKLSIRAINSKVVASSVDKILLEPNSKQQVLLPIEVLASGESALLAQLTNLDNRPIGYPVNINLKLSVISPVATWITSGAAVLLFLAAIVQSVRRVRRRK